MAALAAGGFLADQEAMELQKHTAACVECVTAEEEFAELFRFGLPLTLSPVREFEQIVLSGLTLNVQDAVSP